MLECKIENKNACLSRTRFFFLLPYAVILSIEKREQKKTGLCFAE